MKATIKSSGNVLCTASQQLLSNNIEAYENTIPDMLSDRLRNPKFAGPENSQTGIAAEWEPDGNGMGTFHCRLVPGMYLSGTESQMIHNYSERGAAGILQYGVKIVEGEELEVEMWARARRKPVTLTASLSSPGVWNYGRVNIDVTEAHWQRVTGRITVEASCDNAYFKLNIPGDSMVYIDQVHLRPVGQPNVAAALTESFDHFPCPVLRFPGGCESCTYHWQHGVGPVHLRPVQDDPAFKYKTCYDFGTDEYLELCAAKNIRPFITLNTTTATPDDAAGWAAYIRKWYEERNLEIPAAYFMVGNENYGCWEIGHMTGEMYVSQLRQFSAAVRGAYPEAKIVAIAEPHSHALRDGWQTPWRSLLLEQAQDAFDCLTMTSYAGVGDTAPIDETMQLVAERVADRTVHLDSILQDMENASCDSTFGIAEWNFWSRASHNDHVGFFEPNDIRHCLFGAGYLNLFCRMGARMEYACYYSLVNTMGMIHLHDGEMEYSDLVKVFNLYEPALPGETLELDIDAPAYGENTKAVDACFLKSKDATYGFLINFHHAESVEVSLDGLGSIREATGLRADAILQPVNECAVEFSGSSVTLPPMSLVRVTL